MLCIHNFNYFTVRKNNILIIKFPIWTLRTSIKWTNYLTAHTQISNALCIITQQTENWNTGFGIIYQYNPQGYLSHVKTQNDQLIWQGQAYHAREQVTQTLPSDLPGSLYVL